MSVDLKELHKLSFKGRPQLLQANTCGCFYCFALFSPKDIEDWADDRQTAICPHCGIDSIIPDTAQAPLTESLLKEMHQFFFKTYHKF